MILHHFPLSQNSRRVVGLLESAGLPWESRLVDLAAGDQRRPDFLALNPFGQVPVLEDDGLVLFESNAILRHICLSRGLTDWLPEAGADRARTEQWLEVTQCRFSRPASLVFFNRRIAPEPNEALIAEGLELLTALGPILEASLADRNWLAADRPTIADLALITCLQMLELVGERPRGRAIDAWFARCNALPGVRASLPPAMAKGLGLAEAA